MATERGKELRHNFKEMGQCGIDKDMNEIRDKGFKKWPKGPLKKKKAEREKFDIGKKKERITGCGGRAVYIAMFQIQVETDA